MFVLHKKFVLLYIHVGNKSSWINIKASQLGLVKN